MTVPFGVGVLGATGFIGAPYRAEIRDCPAEARIVALCARRQDLLRAAASDDGALLATGDWRKVVEHPEVNLVVVATPDLFHHQAVMACAALGKHVVCEKPVAMTARQAGLQWRLVRDARLGHFVPFWTRYVPVFRRARELVHQGLLGEVRAAVYRWHNPRPPGMPFTWRDDAARSSAGSLADVGSHAYDTLRWLLGQEAARVLATGAVLTPPKPDAGDINLEEALRAARPVDLPPGTAAGPSRQGTAFDYASLACTFENGAAATLVLSHAAYLRKGLAPECELHGTQASLGIDRLRGQLMLARPGEDPALLETVADPGFGNRFRKHVFPALRARMAGQPTEHPGLDDGYRVQLFTDAALRSARLGQWQTVAEEHDG